MTSYQEIRRDVRDGDVAVWRNGGLIGRVDGWTHVSRFAWYGNTLLLVEFREFRGGQIVTASDQIRRYPGSACIFRPNLRRLQSRFATELMVRQIGKRYGWWIIARQVWQRAGLLRLASGFSFDEHDMTPMDWTTPKDCSGAVVWSDRMAMGESNKKSWPCQGKADWACTPADVANDKAFYDPIHSDVVIE